MGVFGACACGPRDGVEQLRLEGMDREKTIVLHCHHGSRSQRAGEHLLKMGFRDVYNVTGGIDAWSQEVDPNIPRY